MDRLAAAGCQEMKQLLRGGFPQLGESLLAKGGLGTTGLVAALAVEGRPGTDWLIARAIGVEDLVEGPVGSEAILVTLLARPIAQAPARLLVGGFGPGANLLR